MAQRFLQGFEINTLGKAHRGEGVPLRYNYDKPEEPYISRLRGFAESGICGKRSRRNAKIQGQIKGYSQFQGQNSGYSYLSFHTLLQKNY